MVDYSLGSDFDIQETEWGTFKEVDGLEEFEQDVVVTLHDKFRDVIQLGLTTEAKEKIRLAINRTAQEYDQINSIEQISVEQSVNKKNTFKVSIVYNTGDTFSELF